MRKLIHWLSLVLWGFEAGRSIAAADSSNGVLRRKAVNGGVSIELTMTPTQGGGNGFREGDNVRFRIALTESAAGSPLRGSTPAAWMDLEAMYPGEVPECSARVNTLVSGNLFTRAALDLNAYYVLAMNEDATITVTDPLFGYAATKLLAMVRLESPADDWALLPDGSRLFVSMPESNQVAVVDTVSWKIAGTLPGGKHPARLAIQPDAQYVWVTHDGGPDASPPGVFAFSTAKLTNVADISTGPGLHDLAFSEDNRFAFVSNSGAGTVSLIDIRTLTKIKDIAVGRKPVSIAYSTVSKMAYVANEGDGFIAVIDSRRQSVAARIEAEPGIGQIRFSPDGRLAFIANPERNYVHILDAALNRIVQTADLEGNPDQVTFSDKLAYIRQKNSETVLMVPLEAAGTAGKPVPLVDFPAGSHALGAGSLASSAPSIVQAPGENSVLVANPLDGMIYFYKEGMAAPVGSFSNYSHQPRAVIVVDRSLDQTAPGVFETTAKLPRPGAYTFAFLLDAPRLTQCFSVDVQGNPELEKMRQPPLRIEPLFARRVLRSGQPAELRFRVVDAATGLDKPGLTDLRAVAFLSPGTWSERKPVEAAGGGIYTLRFVPPRAGTYRVSLECPSHGITFRNGFSASFEAMEPE